MAEKYSKVKFSAQEEKTLIDFVKSHEILYNAHHKKYRDAEAKHRVWLKLAKSINKDVESVIKKWKAIRDYYVRLKKTKSTGMASTSATSKRDELLSFLNQSPRAKQTSVQAPTADVPTSKNASSTMTINHILYGDSYIDNPDFEGSFIKDEIESNVDTQSYTSDVGLLDGAFSSASAPTVSEKRKCSQNLDINDILHEFLANRPKLSDYVPQKPVDNIQLFCDSIAATLRKFPPLTVARTKLKISNIVGEAEIAWAQQQSTMEFNHWEPNTAVQASEENTVTLAAQSTSASIDDVKIETEDDYLDQI